MLLAELQWEKDREKEKNGGEMHARKHVVCLSMDFKLP
jgi:hypothetical protein